MSKSDLVLDPTDVAGINAATASWAVGEEAVKPISLREVVVADDALEALADLAAGAAGDERILMVMDSTPMTRGGEDLKTIVADTLARHGRLATLVLPEDATHAFHATLEAAEGLVDRLSGHGAVVVVGSGSITDVVKYARHLHANASGKPIPLISFPTAASVTAYTSALAVLKVDGVKRTLPSRPPDMVVCDLKTLADAPPAMVLAGFGDVLARSVSYGDWYLAWQLGMDDGFSEVPGKMLTCAEQAMIDAAEAVATGTLDGIRTVNDALLLAGMAMSVVNQTAPVSGWEHVISHFLDMTADHDGRLPAFHGAQVGVATLVSAYAYERAWGALDLDRLAAVVPDAAIEQEGARIHETFNACDPSGKMAAEVWRDYRKKALRWQAQLETRQRFAAAKRAGEHDGYLGANVRSADEVARALQRATAPRQFDRLDQPITEARAFAAIQQGHLVRSRFTLGDLLDRGGWLTEQNVRGLLDATRR